MSRTAWFDRLTPALWRVLLRLRGLWLTLSCLWASLLLLALFSAPWQQVGIAPLRWLSAAGALVQSQTLAQPATLLGRLFWSSGVVLCGLTVLALLAEWLPRWQPAPSPWTSYGAGDTTHTLEQTAARLATSAGSALRLQALPQDEPARRTYLVASPASLPSLLRGALLLGLLATLIGSWVMARWGWTSPAVELVVGQQRAISVSSRGTASNAVPGGDLTLALQEIRIAPQPTGAPQISAQLLVTRGEAGQVVVASSQRPGTLPGLRIALPGHGAAYRVQARDAQDQATSLRQLYADLHGELLRIPFDDAQQEKWVSLVDQGLLLRLHYVAQPDVDAEPYLVAQLLESKSGRLLVEQQIDGAGQLRYNDLTVEITPEAFVRLICYRAPQRPLAWLALALLVVGVFAILRWPSRTVWLVLESLPDGAGVQWAAGGQVRRGPPAWLDQIMAELRDEEADDGAP